MSSKTIALTVALGTVSSFAAQAVNVRCTDCSEDTYRFRALATGVGDHYVYDFARGNLRHFFVECFNGNAPDPIEPGKGKGSDDGKASTRASTVALASCNGQLYADLLANDPTYTQVFLDVKAVWDATGGTMAKQEVVDYDEIAPVGNPPPSNHSAYAMLSDWNYRARLGNSVGMWAFEANRVSYILNLGSGYVGFTDGMVITIVVNFPDGTKAEFKATYPSQQAEYVSGTARTPDGQAIPEGNAPNFAGDWSSDFGNYSDPNPAYEQFVDHLRRLGIPVVRGGGRILRCTWDGQTLKCYHV